MNIPGCPSDLLGAYALDALDDERVAVEEHLALCPRCRHEVARHHEVVATLVRYRVAPPNRVWEELLAQLGHTGDPERPEQAPFPGRPPLGPADPGRLRAGAPPPRRPRSWAYLAAVTAVAASFVGIATLTRGEDPSLERSVLTALSDPGIARLHLASTASPASGMILVDDSHGHAVLDGLPVLPDGRTYQLWALDRDGTRHPNRVLGPNPTIAAFDFRTPAAGFAITDEPAGGVRTSEEAPVMIGWLDT